MTEIDSVTKERAAKLALTIGRLFGVDPATIDDRSSSDSIEKWDSLGTVNLVSELETEFGIEFDLLEIAEFKNVGTVKQILRNKGVSV